MEFMYVVGGGAIAVFLLRTGARLAMNAARRKRMMEKYGDPQIVDLIMAEKICQGMTREQLHDSWGKPDDIAERLLKTKKVETFKYTKLGRNRFANRVEVENGVVVGWQTR